MAADIIWKCQCGMEWKADLQADGQRSVYFCNCGNRHEVAGTVIGLYCLPSARASRPVLWKEVAAVERVQIYARRSRVDRSQDPD